MTKDELDKAYDAATDFVAELRRATKIHGRFHNAHEGYAVLLEEVEELWEEIKKNKQNPKKIRGEAVQVGAMALRLIVDLNLIDK